MTSSKPVHTPGASMTPHPVIPDLLRHGSAALLYYRDDWQGDADPCVTGAISKDSHGKEWAHIMMGIDGSLAPVWLNRVQLNYASSFGRHTAREWLGERGYPTTEDRPEVLAWSVASVSLGGKPLIGVAWAPDPGALVGGWALFNPDDFTLTLPALPVVVPQ